MRLFRVSRFERLDFLADFFKTHTEKNVTSTSQQPPDRGKEKHEQKRKELHPHGASAEKEDDHIDFMHITS
jgi:hypothetical protein